MILDKTLCHLRNFLLRSESVLIDWCGTVKFSDSAACIAKYWRHIHSAIQKNRTGNSVHQMWHRSTEQKECRSLKAVRFTKRLELRSFCVCQECSSWLSLQNAWQPTLFYSVTWRNEMIYTHSHVSFCRLKITVGYLSVYAVVYSVEMFIYLRHYLKILFSDQAYEYLVLH